MRVLFLVFSLLLLTNTAQAESQSISLKGLVDHFNAVVFIHEHGKTGREPKPLAKWVQPIVYSPSGTLTKDQVTRFFDLMKQIQRLTKLDMRMANRGEKANLIVNFIPRKVLEKQKAGVNCYGTLNANKNYEIKFGRAFIPSDRPDKTNHCLVEETVQLFGLTNDSAIIKNSMFYEQSKRDSLSVSDQILLKTLYDPRLKPGMTKAQAQPIVAVIIQEIIDKARARQKS